MTEPEVVSLMASAISFRDWETKVKQVEAAHDGRLPNFWMRAIYFSGLKNDLMHEWSKALMTVRRDGPNLWKIPIENTSIPLRVS